MADVTFRVSGASAPGHAVSPEILLALSVSVHPEDTVVENALLRCIVRIEAGARVHGLGERERQRELFGGPGVWERSSKQLVWTRATVVAPAFQGTAVVEIALPCSFDLAAAASKYVLGLSGGHVPLVIQPSGTLFVRTESGLSVSQIPHDREARFALPVEVFQQALGRHFDDSALLSVRRDVFDRLDRYRVAGGFPTWEGALENLLRQEGGRA